MHITRRHCHLAIAWLLAQSRKLWADDVLAPPSSAGNSGASKHYDLPVVWDDSRNVIWKCALPPAGESAPVIANGAIFVTSHTPDNKLLLLKIDQKSGEIAWTREVGPATLPQAKNQRPTTKAQPPVNLAVPTPVADGKTVVAQFGNGVLAAYDYAGELQWKQDLQTNFGPFSLPGALHSSPVLYNGLVISACMQDSLADLRDKPVESYLVAHDIRDGHVKWKQSRMTGAKRDQGDAYTTPLLVKVGEQTQLVTLGANVLDGRDPATGEELWRLTDLFGGRTIGSPTSSHSAVFFARGNKGPFHAVKIGGRGKLPRSAIAWTYDQGTPDRCSPVIWDTLLYTISDDGLARCFDLFTGQLKWKERLKGTYWASPMAAAGRIFFVNTSGLCTVVAASPRFDKLTENQLSDTGQSSPTTSNGRLYLRGRKSLYCLGQGPK